MKKLFAFVVVAAAMMFTAPIASATITTPINTAVTATGTVTFRGNIISTSCSASLGGRVTSTTTVSVTAATFSNCGLGVVLTALFTGGAWTKVITLSPRAWTISNVQIQLVQSALGLRCLYLGSLSGTYVPSSPTDPTTGLTITSNTLRLQSPSSGSCTTAPTVTGSLRASATTR